MLEADKGPIIKVATRESVLLSWRAFIALSTTAATTMGGIALAWLSDIKTSQTSMEARFHAYQLGQEARFGKIEGEVNGIKSSALVHQERLVGVEKDLRTVWQRMYDQRLLPPK